MNKIELIRNLKERSDLTKQEATDFVKIFFTSMADTLIDGGRVEIRGLMSLYAKQYGNYTGRNPKTGQRVLVPAKKLPFFKCGKELKERVDPNLKS